MNRSEPTSSSGQNDVEATVPNDFAHLPNEIIHDVVDSHGAERRSIYEKLETLVKIEGSWGEFARDLSNVCDKNISHEDAQSRFICYSVIEKFSIILNENDLDLDLQMKVAPKLYDVITIRRVPDTYCKALNLMGTRFSSICWNGNNPTEAATPELVNFIRRQLLSNYLRKLSVYDVKFEDGAFDDQMEVFVKRPSFEFLSMGAGSYPVPFQIFKEAHKTWLAPNALEFKNREIYVLSSKQTVEKLEDYFETKFPFITEHPENSNAKMRLSVHEQADYRRISMNLSGL